MREYELTYIIASDADEQELNALTAQVQKWAEEFGGTVLSSELWGTRRRLAYSIGEYNEGYYVTVRMNLPPQQTIELERNLRLNERVLRHLLLRADEI